MLIFLCNIILANLLLYRISIKNILIINQNNSLIIITILTVKNMDTFRVYARCRPFNQLQINYGSSRKAVSILDQTTLCLNDGNGKQHIFQLDDVFNQKTTNKQIFNQSIVPLIDNVINGINSTAFAYGITGAGKSFTMFGRNDRNYGQEQYARCSQLAGIIPLTFQYLNNLCQNQADTKIKISYLEIYNEQVYDLLQETQNNLQLSQDPVQGCVIVQDLTQIQLCSFQQAQQMIAVGNSRRVIAQTKANQVSSRSHAIVIINLQRKLNDVDRFYTAKLSLVDLAGSEKQSVHAQTRGIRTFQGSNINRSLLTLGNCINILSQKRRQNSNLTQQFIPYRDSKLTRLLKDSLGGNTKTVMIACISPSCLCYDETVNTLKYACRANKIQKVVHQNIREVKNVEEYKKQIVNLKKQNQMLKMNLNMSLMMPGLSVGIVEQQMQAKRNIVSSLLEKLNKTIQDRAMMMSSADSQQRLQSISQLIKVEEQLRQNILSEFQIKNNKNCAKQSKHQQFSVEPTLKRRPISQKTSQYPNQTKRISESIKYDPPVNDTKKQSTTNNRTSYSKKDKLPSYNQKTNYSQYKVSLKQQLKASELTPQIQQLNNFDVIVHNKLNRKNNNNLIQQRSKNFSVVNLQNLRKKVMEDKKQFSNFKQQISKGTLTRQQIQTKAIKLLQMQQQATMRLSQDQIAYLKKLLAGHTECELTQKFSSAKKKFQSLSTNCQNLQPSQFILNMIQQNIAIQPSRNRHLKSLNRIISLAKYQNNSTTHLHNNPYKQQHENSGYIQQPQYRSNQNIYDIQDIYSKYKNTYRQNQKTYEDDQYHNTLQHKLNRNYSQFTHYKSYRNKNYNNYNGQFYEQDRQQYMQEQQEIF